MDPKVEPAVMVAESTPGARMAWRQYFVITDQRCVVVEMLPALFGGWKFHRVMVQGANDWPHHNRDAIVAFKLSGGNTAGLVCPCDLGAFREKLLAVAAAGRLPEPETTVATR